MLYWLSGLTCTEQNFITKAGAQRYAAEHGVILVAPDTSPRGAGVADADGYDLGIGAGFYVDATQAPWSTHYRMHDYVARRAAGVGRSALPGDDGARDQRAFDGRPRRAGRRAAESGAIPQRVGILADRRAQQVPWGQKAFAAYLGEDRETWTQWDATALITTHPNGCRCWSTRAKRDEFLATQLKPRACAKPATRQVIRSTCVCVRATTTATTSSRVSSASTLRTMQWR